MKDEILSGSFNYKKARAFGCMFGHPFRLVYTPFTGLRKGFGEKDTKYYSQEILPPESKINDSLLNFEISEKNKKIRS